VSGNKYVTTFCAQNAQVSKVKGGVTCKLPLECKKLKHVSYIPN
jgi:hypothetical protein